VIAQLFIAGFMASMIIGTVVGALSDIYGRKLMCQVFAVFYFIAGITKMYNNFHVLLFGRILSGIATSLLFSTFESWMVCEHNKRGFSPALLGNTFGLATLGNGLVAVTAGLVAGSLADTYGFVAPFIGALIPLFLVFAIVTTTWNENYGDSKVAIVSQFKHAYHAIKDDLNVASLGAAQSSFEGAMYTFVFMWNPALIEEGSTLPLGTIFAAFMVCVMVGSSIFTLLMRQSHLEKIPFLIHGGAALCAMVPAYFGDNKTLVYLSFLGFELICGIFFPAFGTLRSKYIPEDTRASVMNFFRIPLNAFVVVLLMWVKHLSIATVFFVCVAAHVFSFAVFLSFDKTKAKKVDGPSKTDAEREPMLESQ
jgi:MFS family permease